MESECVCSLTYILPHVTTHGLYILHFFVLGFVPFPPNLFRQVFGFRFPDDIIFLFPFTLPSVLNVLADLT